MGNRKRLKDQFIAAHPICCFCGGNTAATEEDHVPARTMFDLRQWPEGYVFPACSECNRETRHDEHIVSMLSKMYPDVDTKERLRDFEESVRGVSHNYPEVIEEMFADAREKRKVAKKYNLLPFEGEAIAELPLVKVDGPRVTSAINNFGRKLFLALYYKHAKRVLGSNGGIAIRWFSNLQIMNDQIPVELAPITNNFPEKLERANTSLQEQFNYRYGFSDNHEIYVFIAFFRRTFAILGYVHADASRFNLPKNPTIFRPYARAKSA